MNEYNIKYKILVSENSNKKINNFQLQYGYMYILKNNYLIKNLKNNYFVLTNDFKYNNKYYLIFWVKKIIKNFKIITKNIDNLFITYFLIKPEDSYVITKKKIYNNVNDILIQQYNDLIYKKYKYSQILSTPLFNIITSNKILYHKYFIKKKIILNTTIKNLSYSDINKYNSSYIIKAPYSSSSACVKIHKFMSKQCYLNNGVIVSKKNYTTLNYELKIHVYNGNIIYCVVKNKYNKVIILNSKLKYTLKTNDKIIIDIVNNINKYCTNIITFIKKVYRLMNKLIFIIKFKLDYELNNFIKPLKLQNKIFYNINKKKKLNILNKKIKKEINKKEILMIKKYIKFIKLSPLKIKKKFKLNITKNEYSDKYMRIDIMLPDNKNYNEISLLEIEPYACGKAPIWDIKKIIKIKHINYFPESAQSLIFTKYFQNYIKKYKIKWTKI